MNVADRRAIVADMTRRGYSAIAIAREVGFSERVVRQDRSFFRARGAVIDPHWPSLNRRGVYQTGRGRADCDDNAPLAGVTREVLEPLWLGSRLSLQQIASRLGVTKAAVQRKAARLGLPHRGKRILMKASADEFQRMWEAGVAVADIAAHFGYSHPSNVSSRARKMGLPPRQRVKGAGRSNGKGLIGWGGTITLAQFREMEIGRRWAESVGRAA